MSASDRALICCPYCGESFETQIDVAGSQQDYVEDCTICCRPIAIHVERDEDGSPSVSVAREND